MAGRQVPNYPLNPIETLLHVDVQLFFCSPGGLDLSGGVSYFSYDVAEVRHGLCSAVRP